jgi:hypothetical protein
MVEVRFWSPEKDPDMGARGRQQEHDEDDDADGDRLTSRLRTISTESAASEVGRRPVLCCLCASCRAEKQEIFPWG